jgi:putative membrane protein
MLLLHLPTGTQAAVTLWDFLLAWQLEPLVLVPLLALGGLYLVGARRLGRLHRGVSGPERRQRCFFLAAYLTLAVALLSPLHSFSEELFVVHMVQHVLLMSVAAPLLLLANPMPIMLWSLPAERRAAVGHLLAAERWPIRLLRQLTRPAVAWWLFVADLWLWHQPAAYQAALENEWLHLVQHLLFFGTAVLFWWPVIGPAPLRSRLSYPSRMLYVFVTWLPNSVLGAGITFAPSVLLPFYAARPRHFGLEPLVDQQLAGLTMWLPGDGIYAAAMMILLLATLRQEDRRDAQAAVR